MLIYCLLIRVFDCLRKKYSPLPPTSARARDESRVESRNRTVYKYIPLACGAAAHPMAVFHPSVVSDVSVGRCLENDFLNNEIRINKNDKFVEKTANRHGQIGIRKF